jgi:hypothetical protein
MCARKCYDSMAAAVLGEVAAVFGHKGKDWCSYLSAGGLAVAGFSSRSQLRERRTTPWSALTKHSRSLDSMDIVAASGIVSSEAGVEQILTAKAGVVPVHEIQNKLHFTTKCPKCSVEVNLHVDATSRSSLAKDIAKKVPAFPQSRPLRM